MGQPQLEAFTPHAELVSADALGIELELEGFTGESMDQASRLVRPLWTIIGDGSLRNGGAEFITQGGFGGTKLIQAIDKLQVALGHVNYDASWRCSTHMHINMLDFTCNQVARFILVYAACEPVLFEFCGAYRKSSNFCTPLGDSLPFHRKIMSRMYDDAVSRRSPQQHANKYVALNILPLFPDQRGRALGTVEFRGGRPLVDRAEMLTQANLLLSMKQYVRDFVGDEEAMLTALAQGVHNTVFANGVAANIIPTVDQLELSLVNAWALLKSYQEGVTVQRARAAEMERMGIREDEEIRTIAPSIFGRAPVPESPYRGSHLINDGVGMALENRDTLALLVREEFWPSIFRHHQQMIENRDPMNQLLGAFSTAGARSAPPSDNSISSRNTHIALLNWAGNLTPESAEQNPVGTLVRMRAKTSRSRPRAYEEPLCNLPAEPDTRIKPTRCMYQQLLPADAWRDLLSRIGYTSDAKNIDVWNWLANHVVRTKGRNLLAEHVTLNRSDRDTDMAFDTSTPVSTVRFMQLLRMFALPSRDHVWTSDRSSYDNVCYVIALLNQYDCDIPYIYKRPGQVPRMIWGRANVTSAGFGHTYIRELTLRTESRTADRTIRGETLAQVTIY